MKLDDWVFVMLSGEDQNRTSKSCKRTALTTWQIRLIQNSGWQASQHIFVPTIQIFAMNVDDETSASNFAKVNFVTDGTCIDTENASHWICNGSNSVMDLIKQESRHGPKVAGLVPFMDLRVVTKVYCANYNMDSWKPQHHSP